MLNILVAEDDADDLETFKEALSEVLPQFNIIHARNGLECLNLLLLQTLPDMIFLDIHMPLKNGLQCLKSINKQHALSGIPIIMLSTSDNMDDVDESYESGATLYLVKPSDVKNLAIALKGTFRLLGRPRKDLRIKENFVVKELK